MIDSVFKVLGSALGIWESKEKTKYQDEYLYLKKSYYEEYNKERADDAVLDDIRNRLAILCSSFSAQVGESHPSNPPK